MSYVDLKKSPSSRIGQPREKQSDDLDTADLEQNSSLNYEIFETTNIQMNLFYIGILNAYTPEILIQVIIIAPSCV